MRLFLSLFLFSLLFVCISCVDPRPCPILELEHQLTPIDGQENTYRITLINHDPLLDPEWIDLHLKINDKDQVNLRVASQLNAKQVNQDGIVVQPNDVLRYFSTYSVDGTSCDTQSYEFSPAQIQINNVQQQQPQPQRIRSVRSAMNYPITQSAQYSQPMYYRSQLRPSIQNTRYASISPYGSYNPLSNTNDFGTFAAAACPAIDAENILTKDMGAENTYTLTFVNNDQTINPDWVDVHLQVEGKEQMNIRLASSVSDKLIAQRGIVILPGETIRYSSTYRVGGVSCDTLISEYTVPINSQFGFARSNRFNSAVYRNARPINDNSYDTFSAPRRYIRSLQSRYQSTPAFNDQNQLCPAIAFDQRVDPMPEQNAYKLSFINKNSGLALDYVDLHYQVNAEPEQNIRIGAGQAAIMEKQGLVVAPASHLTYSFTYSVNGVACDTDKYEMSTPATAPISSPIYNENYINRYNVNRYRVNPINGIRMNNNILPRNQFNRQWNMENVRQSPIESNFYNPYARNIRTLNSAALNSINNEATEQICPNVEFEQKVEKMINNPNLYVVSFVDKDTVKNVDYVDLHYKVDGLVEENVRLSTSMLASWNPIEKTVSQTGIFMNPGSKLRFYFTYAANGVQCESPHYVAQAF